MSPVLICLLHVIMSLDREWWICFDNCLVMTTEIKVAALSPHTSRNNIQTEMASKISFFKTLLYTFTSRAVHVCLPQAALYINRPRYDILYILIHYLIRPYILHDMNIYTRAYKLGRSIFYSYCVSVCLPMTPGVRFVAPTVPDGYFHMIESVVCIDFWPWSILSRTFGHEFAIKTRKYCILCLPRYVTSAVLGGFFHTCICRK